MILGRWSINDEEGFIVTVVSPVASVRGSAVGLRVETSDLAKVFRANEAKAMTLRLIHRGSIQANQIR